jgi:hypothetical protein
MQRTITKIYYELTPEEIDFLVANNASSEIDKVAIKSKTDNENQS